MRAAAASTGFTQPGVSRQIAALEREMGVQLLKRGPRGVAPTPAGAALLPHALLLVSAARQGRSAAQAESVRPAALTIGAVPSAAAALVPAAIKQLQLDGGRDCVVVTGLTPGLADMVIDGELRAAVVTDAPPGLPRHADLRATHVFDDEVAVVLPQGHPLSGRGRVDIRLLVEETWIEDNDGSEVLLRTLGARAGADVRVSRSASDLLAKAGMVAAGLGVALVPGLMLPSLRPDLAVVRLEDPVSRGIFLLTRRDGGDLAQLHQVLVDVGATGLRPG
jgi:DNA-binding transcriptional LysR family regulator